MIPLEIKKPPLISLILLLLFSASLKAEFMFIDTEEANCRIYDDVPNNKDYKYFWSGDCKNGYANGFGIAVGYKVTKPNKKLFTYEGEIVNGYYEGKAYIVATEQKSANFKRSKFNGEVYSINGSLFKKQIFSDHELVNETVENLKGLNKDYRKEKVNLVKKYSNEQKLKFLTEKHRGNIEVSNSNINCKYFEDKVEFEQRFYRKSNDLKVKGYSKLLQCFTYKGDFEQATDVYNLAKELGISNKIKRISGNAFGDYFFSVGDFDTSLEFYASYCNRKDLWKLKRINSPSFKANKESKNYFIQACSAHMASTQIKLGIDDVTPICKIANNCNSYINFQDENGKTALIKSSNFNSKTHIKNLIDKGANVDLVDNLGNTALIVASKNGMDNVVRELLKAGSEVNKQDDLGRTALMLALREGHTHVVRLLLASGANINIKTDSLYTALHYAALGDGVENIELLIKAGADLNVKNKYGHTPASLAVIMKNEKSVDALKSNGAKGEATVKRLYGNGQVKRILYFNNFEISKIESFDSKTFAKVRETFFDKKEIREIRRYGHQITHNDLKSIESFNNGVITSATGYSGKALRCKEKYKDGVFVKEIEYDYYSDTDKSRVKSEYVLTEDGKHEYITFIDNKKVNSRFVLSKSAISSSSRPCDKVRKWKFVEGTHYLNDGTISHKEIRTADGTESLIVNTDLIGNLAKEYIDDEKYGLYHYILKLEKKAGINTSISERVLHNLTADVKKRIKVKKNYSKREAVRVMRELGKVIRSYGFEYDHDHNDIITKAIQDRRMDCDIISMLYLTLGETLGLPLKMTYYPQHAAVIWEGDGFNFYWEATSDKKMEFDEYQAWLGKPYLVNLTKSIGYGRPLSKKDTFNHIISLLTRAPRRGIEVPIIKYLAEQHYDNANPFSYDLIFDKSTHLQQVIKQIESKKNKFNDDALLAFYNPLFYLFLTDDEIASRLIIELYGDRLHQIRYAKNNQIYTNRIPQMLSSAYKYQENYAKAIEVLEIWIYKNGYNSHINKDLQELQRKYKKQLAENKI